MNEQIATKVANKTGIDAATVKRIADQIRAHEEEEAGFKKAIDDVFYLASELKGCGRGFPSDKYAEALTHLTTAREALTSVDAIYRQANQ